jgi:hypothetical protein
MAANTNPIFTLTGNFLPVRLSAGNTASDGSGTIYTIVTAGTDGTRVDGVRFRNSQVVAAVSTAMVHRIFLSGTAGTGHRLVGEVATGAATRNVSTIGATSLFVFDQPIIMQPGQVMSVAQSAYAGAQDQFDAIAYASNY